MNLHTILTFLHILGALGAFMTLAVETVAVGRLRRATAPSEAASWMGVLGGLRRSAGISVLTLVVTGIWLMVKFWHHQPWIDVSMAGLVMIAATGGAVTGRTMRRLGQAFTSSMGQELSPAFHAIRSGGALVMSLRIRLALAVGIVAVMTIKPGYGVSILIMAVAIAAGWLSGLQSTARGAGAREMAGDHSVAAE